MNAEMNFEDEIAKMKATGYFNPFTEEETAANKAYLATLDYDTKGSGFTDAEWAAILEFRKTGKIPKTEYEELDFNNVGS
jgi:hypothetical protein